MENAEHVSESMTFVSLLVEIEKCLVKLAVHTDLEEFSDFLWIRLVADLVDVLGRDYAITSSSTLQIVESLKKNPTETSGGGASSHTCRISP